MSGTNDDSLARGRSLLGEVALERLAAAQVTVAGLGAVGSFAAEALARSGVGHLRLIDFDRVERSNINRQLYALHSTVGQPKTLVAVNRIRDIAPACRVEAVETRINNENAFSLLTPKPDVVVDAIASVCDKVALVCACLSQRIPVVSSMGAARRRDPLAVRSGGIEEATGCPLAKNVKRGLRKAGFDPLAASNWLHCIFSVEPAAAMTSAGDGGCGPSAMGSLVCVTGVFGLVAASEALRLLLEAQSAPNAGI